MQTLPISDPKSQGGFTLVEVMIVVTIIGIIAGIGTTILLNYLPNMRLRSATRDIYSAIMQSKTEAIRRGQSVGIVFNSPNGPFTLFVDIDNDGTYDSLPAPGEPVLQSTSVLPSHVSFDPDPAIAADGDGVSFNNNTAMFSLRGIPNAGGTVGLRATDSHGNTIRQRSIVVSIAGRININ